jgi:LacI family transcriptional regulator
MRDRNIRVGTDVSVCVVNDEGLARYLSPSITSIQMPDPMLYLSACMDWMKRKTSSGNQGDGWVGPLLLQPSQAPLFIGESTGPAVLKS